MNGFIHSIQNSNAFFDEALVVSSGHFDRTASGATTLRVIFILHSFLAAVVSNVACADHVAFSEVRE